LVLDGRPSRDPEMATGIPGGPRGRRKQAKPQRKGKRVRLYQQGLVER
jgi:hypothetical protein